jgi:trehalose 6-phosphate phosphatase
MGVTWARGNHMIGKDEAIERLARSEAVLVGLDFDGVLSEIVARPEDAEPVQGVGEVLADLVAANGIRVAAVSGRRRIDLAERLRPPSEVILVGEHGADHGHHTLETPDRYEDVRVALEAVAERFDGAWVEEKRTGLTIHGRALSESDAFDMATEAEAALSPIIPGLFERGNRVVDVRLTGSTKGQAIEALRAADEVVLFIGDDTTDETVFSSLGPKDVGVKVGEGPTAAICRLADPDAVVRFLQDLIIARSR